MKKILRYRFEVFQDVTVEMPDDIGESELEDLAADLTLIAAAVEDSGVDMDKVGPIDCFVCDANGVEENIVYDVSCGGF